MMASIKLLSRILEILEIGDNIFKKNQVLELSDAGTYVTLPGENVCKLSSIIKGI